MGTTPTGPPAGTVGRKRGPKPRPAPDPTWAPLCMDEAEWARWREMNPQNMGGGIKVAHRPCLDCPRWFAVEMRAEGRCNGTPGSDT